MPRARNSKASICRECKKRLLENKLWEKGHTRLRKHAEKDKKKGKGRRLEVLAEEESNDANACLDQFCRNVKSFKEPIQPHFRATLGAYLARRNHTGGSGIRHDASPLAANFPPGLHHRSSRSRWEDSSRASPRRGDSRMVDRQADRVDKSFISHSLKSNKSAKPSQWQVRPRKHFEKERSG